MTKFAKITNKCYIPLYIITQSGALVNTIQLKSGRPTGTAASEK